MKIEIQSLVLALTLLFASQVAAQNTMQTTNSPISPDDCKPKIGWVPMPCSRNDANLIPENIRIGTTIFGVQGTFPAPETIETAKDECFFLCGGIPPNFTGIGRAPNPDCMYGCEQGMDILYGQLQK